MSFSSLILDSRRRNNGGSDTNFSCNLTPALLDVHRCRLVHSNIPLPGGMAEPYYILSIPELGAHARGASTTTAGTFFIPATSAAGFRSFLAEGSSWIQVGDGLGRNISSLTCTLSWIDGAAALTGGPVCFVLQFE